MANVINTNPLNIDSTGAVIGTDIMIGGIKVVPSNTTWSVILKDRLGNIVYMDNNNAGGEFFATPFKSTGLNIDTLTNVTRVLIYTVPA